MISHILILLILIYLAARLLSLVIFIFRRLNRFQGSAQILSRSAANRISPTMDLKTSGAQFARVD